MTTTSAAVLRVQIGFDADMLECQIEQLQQIVSGIPAHLAADFVDREMGGLKISCAHRRCDNAGGQTNFIVVAAIDGFDRIVAAAKSISN